MKELPKSARQLLLMAALAAANHGLVVQAEVISQALPWLIADLDLRALFRALIYLGCSRQEEALGTLEPLRSEEAQVLRDAIPASKMSDSREWMDRNSHEVLNYLLRR